MSLLILLAFILGLGLLYWYLTKNKNYWKKYGIASEECTDAFWTVLNMLLSRKTLGEGYHDTYLKFPAAPVVGWFKMLEPSLLIRDPGIARKILINDFFSFRNNDIHIDEKLDPIFGKNIFVLKDDRWKKGRALITPAFTAGKIKAIYPVMQEVAKELVEYLKKHPEELHVKHTMSRYTCEVVVRCAFGIEGHNMKADKPEIHEIGKMLFEPSFFRNIVFLSATLLPSLTKLVGVKFVPTKAMDFFNSLLRDIVVYRQENKIDRNDLVQYFLEIKRKSIELAESEKESEVITKVYTDDDVLAGCITFFIEGFETSSLVTNNILYSLARYPDVQRRLREEIDETLAEGDLTFDKLHAMPYLNAIFLESNRYLPVVYALHKLCTEDYEMDVGESKTLPVKKGTPIVLPIFSIHRDPAHWEDANTFKPDRFLDKEAEVEYRTKGIYFPFGDGPRMCPGSRIATTIVKLAIVNICSNFEVHTTSRTPDEIEPDPNYFMIAHKGGIYLRFVERSS